LSTQYWTGFEQAAESMLFWLSMSSVVRRKPVKRRRSHKKASLRNPAFDVKLFLDSAGLGRKVGKFRGKETVFAQGDPAKNVMYIQEGGVKLTVVNETGKEAVVAILGPGDFFGEGCLAGQSICMATATAVAPTTVRIIEKTEMIRVLHGEHEFSDRFIAYMLARNIRIEEDLIDQLFNSSEKRLARTLLLLARYGAPGQPQKVLLKVSQEMLAEMIGSTRPRVNFFMNKFRKLGFIEYNGEIHVNNSLLSVVLHE
jgi:CRP/FNR family transcriptional regulator, cyclic AMP receptor protein